VSGHHPWPPPSRRRIATDDRLYLHFDRHKPKFLVVADDLPFAESVSWAGLGLGLIHVDTDAVLYEDLHKLLHSLLGNECRGLYMDKAYRTKEGSAYGRMIRYGDKEAQLREGCVDLPLFDVDAIEVEDGRVVALVELKHVGERLTQAQRKVIRACRQMGIEYIEDVHEEEMPPDIFEPGEGEELVR
jgi:hypothetical protein